MSCQVLQEGSFNTNRVYELAWLTINFSRIDRVARSQEFEVGKNLVRSNRTCQNTPFILKISK